VTVDCCSNNSGAIFLPLLAGAGKGRVALRPLQRSIVTVSNEETCLGGVLGRRFVTGNEANIFSKRKYANVKGMGKVKNSLKGTERVLSK
jgi:hypothetical protein